MGADLAVILYMDGMWLQRLHKNALLHAHVRFVRGFLLEGVVWSDLVDDRGAGGVRALRCFQCNVLDSSQGEAGFKSHGVGTRRVSSSCQLRATVGD